MYSSPLQQQQVMIQYNNLVNNLLQYGVSTEQILQMSGNGNYVAQYNSGMQQTASQAVSQQTTPLAPQGQEISKQSTEATAEQGLLLKMFSEFSEKDPETAKELSSLLAKFARHTQSVADKGV